MRAFTAEERPDFPLLQQRARGRQGRCAPLARWPAAILDRPCARCSPDRRSGRRDGRPSRTKGWPRSQRRLDPTTTPTRVPLTRSRNENIIPQTRGNSARWPASDRNPGRLRLGTGGRLQIGMPGRLRRNPHEVKSVICRGLRIKLVVYVGVPRPARFRNDNRGCLSGAKRGRCCADGPSWLGRSKFCPRESRRPAL
jgi:hypothetical protein